MQINNAFDIIYIYIRLTVKARLAWSFRFGLMDRPVDLGMGTNLDNTHIYYTWFSVLPV